MDPGRHLTVKHREEMPSRCMNRRKEDTTPNSEASRGLAELNLSSYVGRSRIPHTARRSNLIMTNHSYITLLRSNTPKDFVSLGEVRLGATIVGGRTAGGGAP
jgi:hypothetical protein